MKMINRLFWKGLIVVMPITLSIYLLVVVLSKAESVFGNLIKKALGPDLYVPGFGLLLTFIAMILVGVLVSNLITGSIIKFFLNLIERVPFFKAIYNPLKDLMSLFAGSGPDSMKKVVLVNFEKLGFQSIGLVTREEFDDISSKDFGEDDIAVYIPMSYMLGGFTAIVPRTSVKEIDIPVERAIKLALTGWIKADKNAL